MTRKSFLQLLSALSILKYPMQARELKHITQDLNASEKMPLLFLGHGSPMNAITENEFTAGFKQIATTITKPNAILCISAHWETKGTFVTAMEHPQTIHDFGGFPEALYQVQYPAPGQPQLAKQIQESIQETPIGLDEKWGLDHGAWSVIKHLYPHADVPVLQLSIDYTKPAIYHYELAKQLAFLRRKGVLIIGSGNIVHNLGQIAWNKMETDNFAFDWATETNEKIKQLVQQKIHKPLIEYNQQGAAFKLAIPTPEHYLPLLYVLGLQEEKEDTFIFNDKAVAGSLTMTSFKII